MRVLRGGPFLALAVVAATGLTVGCAVPVATDLDELAANRVVAALDESGIGSEKTTDVGAEGRFRVEVTRDDASRAVTVLTADALPPRKATGLIDALETNALVPSRLSEYARFLAGLSGELEQSLSGVDGVLSARVHLAVPRPDPLNAESPPKPSASVLIRYRGTRAPISVPDVQRLVAGAVPGLAPDAVAVILAPAVTAPPARDVVRLGPFSTRRETANQVRLLAAGVALLDIALVGCLVTVWLRLRRLIRPGRPGNGR